MRQVLSLSLPSEVVVKIKKTAKDGGYDSISEYIKNLFLENSENIISKKELVEMVREAEKEYKAGKTIKANSLADLL